MENLDWGTGNQKAKAGGHGATAHVYPGGKGVPLPRGGGFSKGTKHRVNDEQAVKGSPYPGKGESGTEAD